MNPEFVRQTVKKLLWLSDYLVSELDPSSDNYWQKHMKFIFGRVQKMIELVEDGHGKDRSIGAELYIDPWLMRQYDVARLLETDPFVPPQIRKTVADFYFERVDKMTDAYLEAMNQFWEDWYNGKIKDTNLELKIQAWVRLGELYEKQGWTWEVMENRIIDMRGEIEKYLINLK